MLDRLKKDAYRYRLFESLCFRQKVMKFVFSYGLHAMFVYRFGRWVNIAFQNRLFWPAKTLLNMVYLVCDWLIRKAYGVTLSRQADIGPGLYIGHFGGIKVGPCTIGTNCSIQQQVKILPDTHSGRLPKIGKNVWIGGHATVVGCTVGDGATIAAGAHVSKDIGCRNLAVGNPARVVLTSYDNTEILGAYS